MQAFAPDHYYVVRLYALNSLGEGTFSETIFRTPGTCRSLETQLLNHKCAENMRTIGAGMSAGIVVLIIFIVLLVVFLGIDLFCYMARECGLLWCLSASVRGMYLLDARCSFCTGVRRATWLTEGRVEKRQRGDGRR